MDLPRENIRQVAIVGPTASGKTDFALNVARRLRDQRGIQVEIISCDSVQVYRGFDIGSAKSSSKERSEFPHHLIDVVDWKDDFDAGVYATKARDAVASIQSRGALPVIVGGTGLYFRALLGQGFEEDLPRDEGLRLSLEGFSTAGLFNELKQMDPVRAAELHPNDRVRILRAVELCRLLGGPVSAQLSLPRSESGQPVRAGVQTTPMRQGTFILFLNPERQVLHERIAERVKTMLNQGLLDEVDRILAAGCPIRARPMQAIGYREVAETLIEVSGDRGQLAASAINGLAERIIISTRQYAKRQITWFKGVNADRTVTSFADYESAIAGLCALDYVPF